MKCYYHKEKEAKYSCKLCNHPLCKQCAQDVKGQYFCKDCLQKLVDEKMPEKNLPPSKSPGGAALLSMIPGLGQFYNGQLVKGIGVIFLFASCIALADMYGSGPLFPLMAMFVYFVGIVDAYRTAKMLNLKAEGLAQEEKAGVIPEGSLWWGAVLMLVGVLFLMHNFGVRLYWLRKLWPLLIIGLGIYLIRNFFLGIKKTDEKTNKGALEKEEKK